MGTGLALTWRLHWFETEVLTQDENLDGLIRINRELITKVAMDSPQRVVLDMHSTEIPVYGQQARSAYNGHFELTCYHPLLLLNGVARGCAGRWWYPGRRGGLVKPRIQANSCLQP